MIELRKWSFCIQWNSKPLFSHFVRFLKLRQLGKNNFFLLPPERDPILQILKMDVIVFYILGIHSKMAVWKRRKSHSGQKLGQMGRYNFFSLLVERIRDPLVLGTDTVSFCTRIEHCKLACQLRGSRIRSSHWDRTNNVIEISNLAAPEIPVSKFSSTF